MIKIERKKKIIMAQEEVVKYKAECLFIEIKINKLNVAATT